MSDRANLISADDKRGAKSRGPQHDGATADGAATPVTITVSNPGPTGVGQCSVDGTSMTAFGNINPASSVPTMTCTLQDAQSKPVGQCRPCPIPPGCPAGTNWAFAITQMPSGNPRPQLTVVVTGTNGSQSSSISTSFSCGGPDIKRPPRRDDH